MIKGLFIVFEGIDGAGKTTQVNLLSRALAGTGRQVLVTRDPGGTALGESLRKLLLYGSMPIDPVSEALVYAAARAQLAAERILPALDRGTVVISDRFSGSTVAYQGYGRGMDIEMLTEINRYACLGLTPDITVLLDMDPVQALNRLDRPADRMEREGREFLRRVRKGYLDQAGRDPARYLVLDASLPAGVLSARIQSAVGKIMPQR